MISPMVRLDHIGGRITDGSGAGNPGVEHLDVIRHARLWAFALDMHARPPEGMKSTLKLAALSGPPTSQTEAFKLQRQPAPCWTRGQRKSYRYVQRPLHLLIQGEHSMAEGRFVSYLRVSTDAQGRSGLGLEAQRKAVADYLNGGRWKLLREFVEVESGRRADRPKLDEAFKLCRAHRAALVVAKVDRLTRSHHFLSKITESRVEVRFCDLPQLEGPTGKFLLQQMVSVAELEAGMIGDRTKKALAAVKARGKKQLGGFRGRAGTAADLIKARAERTRLAQQHAADIAPVLERLDPDGDASLRTLARMLNEEEVQTSTGRGLWTAAAVSRVKQRLELR